MADNPDYEVVRVREVNDWNDDEQKVTSGFRIYVRSKRTNQRFSVFMPGDTFSPDNNDKLIRHHLAMVDGTFNLG
jgi:hypothetical protein